MLKRIRFNNHRKPFSVFIVTEVSIQYAYSWSFWLGMYSFSLGSAMITEFIGSDDFLERGNQILCHTVKSVEKEIFPRHSFEFYKGIFLFLEESYCMYILRQV